MSSHWLWWLVAWLMFVVCIILFFQGAFKMVDVNALQKEVQDDLDKEMKDKAKSQLKQMERDIRNAKQLVENLERKKKDLLIAIGEGTN